jgi:hypothetical protein
MALNPEIRKKTKSGFEQRCFQLIIEAYKTSLIYKAIKSDWNENDISSEIHKHIKTNPLRQKWKVSTNVEAHISNKKISREKGFADKDSRIDFRLTSFISTYEYEYFFEAKNLKQYDSALKRRYINTGIDNFVLKKYENGGLIGYLLEGKIDETIKGINSLLEKDKRNTEILSLKSDKLLKTIYESTHSDIGILKHLIFDFTNLFD